MHPGSHRDWNPAVNDQAVDRCHRIGQTKPVTVYVLVAADTVDETIYKRAAGKKEKSESLLDKGDAEGGAALDGSGRRCVRACVHVSFHTRALPPHLRFSLTLL